MAGNIQGFLDRYTDPVKIAPEADLRGLDHRMCAAYTDGSKLGIEMALVANACGLRVMTPGTRRKPCVDAVEDVLALFDFDAIAADAPAVVDYVLGARPHGGVFVVGRCDDAYQRSMLKYYKMGSGPFYLFYRPYHLCHIEAIRCIAEAFLDGQDCLQWTTACSRTSSPTRSARSDAAPGSMAWAALRVTALSKTGLGGPRRRAPALPG